MASLLDTIGDTTVENRMLESVRKCDPQRRQPHLVELEKILPSVQDVYHSYIKLRELCAPESDRIFMVSTFYVPRDSHFNAHFVTKIEFNDVSHITNEHNQTNGMALH